MANNFTRPADTTAYTSGDLVANSTTAGSVVPLSWNVGKNTIAIRRIRVKKSTTSTTNASFRLHLYTASPTCANGDNGAWSTTFSGYVGSLDVTVDKAFSDASGGYGAPNTGVEVSIPDTYGTTGFTTLYGLLEARAAYSPGSAEVFTVDLEIIRT
jgi:hypothetical protein